MLCKAWIKQSMWIRGRFKTIALFPFQDRKASTAMTRPSHKPQRVTLCSSLAPHHIETHSPPCLQRKNKTGWHCTIGNEPSSDSIVTTIANSNRCELEGARIYSVRPLWSSVGLRPWLNPVQLLSLLWRYPRKREFPILIYLSSINLLFYFLQFSSSFDGTEESHFVCVFDVAADR